MNKILFKLFGNDARWLQKQLVKSVVDFNKAYPSEFTCPVVETDWGKAGADWYSHKLVEYTNQHNSIPFHHLAVLNRTSSPNERAKFLQQLSKEFE